jgi:hypothetical protein
MVAAAGHVRVVRRVTNVIPKAGRVLNLHRKKRERDDISRVTLSR